MHRCYHQNSNLNIRYDIFGGLAWITNGPIYRLTACQVMVLDLLKIPRRISEIDATKLGVAELMVARAIEELAQDNLICYVTGTPRRILDGEYAKVKEKSIESLSQTINKPFWVHLQPFKQCNLSCMYCYCDADQVQHDNLKFNYSIENWIKIIDELIEFGVLDVYITGGECFLCPECFDLVQYILDRGMGTGISTNGTSVSDASLSFLRKHSIKYVQVSLNSSNKIMNDVMTGVSGSWEQTTNGIKKLTSVACPVINVVVSKMNLNEVEDIIKLGVFDLGVNHFKLSPVKMLGRAGNFPRIKLNEDDIKYINDSADVFKDKYNVNIDHSALYQQCGAGFSGMAISERGDVYPCIFGVTNSSLRLGNIFQKNVSELWFNSDKLNSFREHSNSAPCSRCEMDLNNNG